MWYFKTALIAGLVGGMGCLWAAEPERKGEHPNRSYGMKLKDNGSGRQVVEEVEGNSPADEAGLKRGDLILSADDHQVISSAALIHYLNKKPLGSSVDLSINRDRERMTVQLQLPKVPTRGAEPTAPGEEAGVLGMFLIENPQGKVLVSKVSLHGPAAEAGIKAGDIVLSVDDFIPESLEAFSTRMSRVVSTGKAGDELTFNLLRGKTNETVHIILPKAGDRPGAPVRAEGPSEVAVARLLGLGSQQGGDILVFVTLEQQGESLQVRAEGSGLPRGIYQLVVHEYGDCGDLHQGSAGERFSPAHHRSAEQQEGLGRIEAKEDGAVLNESIVPGLRLSGQHSLIGRAVVLADSSDKPVAAGVIGIGNPQRKRAASAGVR